MGKIFGLIGRRREMLTNQEACENTVKKNIIHLFSFDLLCFALKGQYCFEEHWFRGKSSVKKTQTIAK